MQVTLPAGAKPRTLPAGVQPAIAASENDSALAVELELISILAGAAFRGSVRSREFLRFVVEEALAGRQDELKERTIGVAVMGKAADYDTGGDSGVRVRANDVRKRLALHYEDAAPKAGIRIELPLGMYAPRFVAGPSRAPAEKKVEAPRPPAMLFWQLAAPTLVAVFLALAVIRTNVETSDTFSRFWDQAIAGRTEIDVEVDSGAGTLIPTAMADAALPFERLSGEFPPVHVTAAGAKHAAGACVIRLSLTEKPAGKTAFRLGRALVFRGDAGGPVVWVWGEDPEALRVAAQRLTSRPGFPM
jgi:hypothetical protein